MRLQEINSALLQDESVCALVIGANGLVGSNMIKLLKDQTRWKIHGLSRSPRNLPPGVLPISADLLNETSSRTALAGIAPQYVFFAALAVKPTPAEQVAPNLAMLRNAITPFLHDNSVMRHVCLIQGTKWYGSHLGPYRTPAREDDPRVEGPNFYYDQHDWLSQSQQGRQWSYSTLRPHFINGFNVGNPNNMIAAIGAYAAIQRACNQPLHFPGTFGAYKALTMMTDVSLLNEAMLWTATSQQCANQDFNLHNGEFFRWKNLWPALARAFDMPVGEPRPLTLSDYMRDKGKIWDRIVAEQGLAPTSLDKLVSWSWADFFFGVTWDDMSSMHKARRFGFDGFIEPEADILGSLERYRAQRILPRPFTPFF